MKKKAKRTYSSGKYSAAGHPIRISIMTLVGEGVDTAPEMAEVLGENRMNLYHHLSYLEKSGLIESYFANGRVKRYKISKTKENLEQNSASAMSNDTIVISPTTNNQIEFLTAVRNLLKISGIVLDSSKDVSQVLISLQSAEKTQLIQENIRTLKLKSKSKQIYHNNKHR